MAVTLYLYGLSPGLFSIIQNLLEYVDKAVECFQSFLGAFIYACVFEYLAEYFTDFLLKDMLDIFSVHIRIGRQEFVYPVRVFLDLFVASDIFPFENIFLQELISPFRRAGRTASPITSISPMFSFLMWCSFACG